MVRASSAERANYAASLEWRLVEPAIFGTLLERALSPDERHKPGAHYTPRAYLERLVLPTVIEPLREEWAAVRAAAVTRHEGRSKESAGFARAGAAGSPHRAKPADLAEILDTLVTLGRARPGDGAGTFVR